VSRDDAESPSLRDQTQAFLHEFFVKGQELIRELIEENERLRKAMPAEPAEPDEPAEPGKLSPTSAEMVGKLMRQVEELEHEAAEIRKIAGTVQTEEGYRDRLDSLEDEHYHLAAMYVALGQFHATITEILLNFVGVGAFTLFVVDEPRRVLFPLWREGGDPAERSEMPWPETGPISDALSRGRAWRPGDPIGTTDDALMHLPMYSGTRLVGVIRVEKFLPQKSGFVDTDFGLLELISGYSGIGIENAWIRAHAEELPVEQQAIEHLVGG